MDKYDEEHKSVDFEIYNNSDWSMFKKLKELQLLTFNDTNKLKLKTDQWKFANPDQMRLFLNFDDTFGRIYLQTQSVFKSISKMTPIREVEIYCTIMHPGKPKDSHTVKVSRESDCYVPHKIVVEEGLSKKQYELKDSLESTMTQDVRVGCTSDYDIITQIWQPTDSKLGRLIIKTKEPRDPNGN